MTNKWKFQKHRAMKSKSSKSVPELGQMIDSNINVATLAPLSIEEGIAQRPKIYFPSPKIVGQINYLTTHFIHCPRCRKLVKLVNSPRRNPKYNYDRVLLECSVCHLWYKSERRWWCMRN